ncbi:MAG: phage tail protein [Desulfovibrionaceae bacterium]|nr:MAG: phage tail protein [Desulfovibrionaceae bacterium]
MASGYQHGVYSGEVPTALLPARYVDTNAVFAVGTAPVHTLGEGKTPYVNTPRLYNSYDAFVAEMGWSEDWQSFTLCEVAESHFAKYGASPLVCVNVFDPEKHLSEENEPDPSQVSAADIIGGIDAKTGKKTGLELIAEMFPRFRIVPGSILAPRFSEDSAVAVSMSAKATGINGLFRALALADVPTDKAPYYTGVPEYKERNNLTGENLVVCWPRIALGERIYHISTQLTGRMSLTDSDNGNSPHVSPSNKQAFMDRAVVVGADGAVVEEVWLGLDENNYLNGQGIVTVSNFDGGWKFWGNRTGCYPSNTDPKDAFIPIRRFMNWYQNTFILTYFSQVDGPITKRFIERILKSEQIRLDGFTARGIINGGRISYQSDENPLTDVMDGLLRFHLWLSPPPPARSIEGIFEFDPTYLEALFGGEA